MADDERTDEERWIDRLLNPLDGPASENAYPEDPVNDPDGTFKLMNDSARAHNRRRGLTDEAAHIPWTPENSKPPEGSELPWLSAEELARREEEAAKAEARLERYERSKLTSTAELPDLDGGDLEITWDHEEVDGEGDDWTVLRHGNRIIWREIADDATFAPILRFDEILWILREKYGPRLASLNPTRQGLLQLRGLGYSARTFVAGLNQELQEKRRPLEPWPSIEVPDAEGDPDDPARQDEELKASVRRIGVIDCSCGWQGDATEARLIGTGAARDINCPVCRRPIARISVGKSPQDQVSD